MGLRAYRIAKRKGYEGVVAKDASSHYVQGRSRLWLKFKVHQEDEFIVVGYTASVGFTQAFRRAASGCSRWRQLIYVGKVGTGFTQKTLADLHRKFQPLVRAKAPVINPLRGKNITYLAPRLVAQIAYEELTAGRMLRQPVFLGLRDDKQAEDVTLPEAN